MLESLHCIKEDPQWGELLSRFRKGELTDDNEKLINGRCLTMKPLKLPADEETLKTLDMPVHGTKTERQ